MESNKDYFVTIIIPHYNTINKLFTLMDSILIAKNIQIIIVDDKSEDQNLLFNEFKKYESYNNILLLKNDTNKKGAGVCRNIALNFVKGKFVLFADSDDFFLKDYYKIISKYKFSDAEIIFFPPVSKNENTQKISKRHLKYSNLVQSYINKPSKKNETSLRYEFYVPWSKMISFNFICKNNLYFSDTLVSNDLYFSTKLGLFCKKFIVDANPIYCVVERFNSLTKQKKFEGLRLIILYNCLKYASSIDNNFFYWQKRYIKLFIKTLLKKKIKLFFMILYSYLLHKEIAMDIKL